MKKHLLLGIGVLTAAGSFAQSTVNSGTQKYVLAEEGTGTWCGHCTDGAVFLENVVASSTRVIPVSVHDNDPMEIPDGAAVFSEYNPAFPNAAIDRVVHVNSSRVFMNRSHWQNMANTQLAKSPDFAVTVQHGYSAATRQLTVKVTAKALKGMMGSYNINAYVVEDSVIGGSAYDQANYYDGTAGHKYQGQGASISGFMHMQVLRSMLGGPWGSSGIIMTNPTLNSMATKTYTYTLPGSSNFGRWRVIGLVQKQNTADKDDRVILNAIQAKITPGTLGLENLAKPLGSLAITPNPASDLISVRGETQYGADVTISIVNTLGQKLKEEIIRENNQQFEIGIPVTDLAAGLYFVNVTTSFGEKVSQKLIITR
ncbi:MAG: Omp28-related outer membrane protein [Sphingobacteriales bacterium]|nr:MAG: Omp28-related outer membrane protein [Sphingobacteriales bacterium]